MLHTKTGPDQTRQVAKKSVADRGADGKPTWFWSSVCTSRVGLAEICRCGYSRRSDDVCVARPVQFIKKEEKKEK